MVNYACVGVLWISLTVCLGQSFEDNLKEQFQDVSPECQESLAACALPLVLPYASASGPSDVLDIARNTRLGEHCRKSRKSFTCFRGLIGEDQCSDFDPRLVQGWRLVAVPILNDIWGYICRQEFKKFSIHYACLLTEEVISNLEETCSEASSPSESIDCLGGVVKEQCGSTASEITKTLLETVIKRVREIAEKEFGRPPVDETGDDDQEKQQSTLPENVYARSLAILKKILKRK